MRSTLRILIFGLLFYSGFGAPAEPGNEDYPADGEDVQKPSSKSSPSITTQPQIFVATPGQDIELPCAVVNNTDDEVVIWTLDDSKLYFDNHFVGKNQGSFVLGSNKSLTLKNFNSSLAGTYHCQVGNSGSIHVSHVVGLKEPPSVEYINGKKYIDVAADLSLECKAKGFPAPIITWYKQNNENSNKEPLKPSINTGANIVIPSVTFSDSGIYTCSASNGEVQDSKTHTVTVISGIAPESSVVHALEAKNSTRLCCVYDKDRKITWLKNGKDLDIANDRFVEDKDKHKTCIIIKTAKVEDLGTYTCQSQKANDLPERADIKLIGSPAKPYLQHVGDDEKKNPILTWNVFSLVPITNLQLYYKKPEENDWKFMSQKTPSRPDEPISHAFSELPNGTYDVKLVATNEFGSSESIENSKVVIDRIEPNVIVSEKVSSGADSHYRVSSLCIMFVIFMRLWSC